VTISDFLMEFGGLCVLGWAILATVLWRRERKRNRRLHAEYREVRDAAIVIHRRNQELEGEETAE
jgi:hypothetical protein